MELRVEVIRFSYEMCFKCKTAQQRCCFLQHWSGCSQPEEEGEQDCRKSSAAGVEARAQAPSMALQPSLLVAAWRVSFRSANSRYSKTTEPNH